MKKAESKRMKIKEEEQIPRVVVEEIEIDDRVRREAYTGGCRGASLGLDVEESTEISKLALFPSLPSTDELRNMSDVPYIANLSPFKAIMCLGFYLGINDWRTSLTSFWFLDTLSAIVTRCQNEEVLPANQKAILNWILWIIKSIAVSGASREETFENLKELWERAEIWIKLNNTADLPLPMQMEDFQPPPDTPPTTTQSLTHHGTLKETSKVSEILKESKEFEKRKESTRPRRGLKINKSKIGIKVREEGKRNSWKEGEEEEEEEEEEGMAKLKPCLSKLHTIGIQDLNLLIDIIYNLLGWRFSYEVIRSHLVNPPEVIPVTILEGLNLPKPHPPPDLKPPQTPSSGTSASRSKTQAKAGSGRKGTKAGNLKLETKSTPEIKWRNAVAEQEQKEREEAEARLYLRPLSEANERHLFPFPWPTYHEKKIKSAIKK